MPYKIAFLSKYPPIEGGISSKTFGWLVVLHKEDTRFTLLLTIFPLDVNTALMGAQSL